MSHDPLTYDGLLRIVDLPESSGQFSGFRVKDGDVEVELRRGASSRRSMAATAAPSEGALPAKQGGLVLAPRAP